MATALGVAFGVALMFFINEPVACITPMDLVPLVIVPVAVNL